MAPAINPDPNTAPIHVVRGMTSNTAANNSPMPVPILPRGSMPNKVNNSTDWGCAVNLKYRVCSKMTAGTILSNHIKIDFPIINAMVQPLWKYLCHTSDNQKPL